MKNAYTLVGNTIWYPKGRPPSNDTIAHEMIHKRQMDKVGEWKFYFLYLLCFPFFYNPWRYKWEYEAYSEANGMTKDDIDKMLATSTYGWLWLN